MLFSCRLLLRRHKVTRHKQFGERGSDSVWTGTFSCPTAGPQHQNTLPRPWPGTAPLILATAPGSPAISLPQCTGRQAPQVLSQLARRGHPWARPPGGPTPSIRPEQPSNQPGLQERARWTVHCTAGSLTATFAHARSLSLPSVWGPLSSQLFLRLTCHPPHVGHLAREMWSALITMGVGLHRHPGSA